MNGKFWKTDLRTHSGQLSDRTETIDPTLAVTAYRALLARADLAGQPIAARLVSAITGRAIYYSRFDRAFGDGRIHPDAPIDPLRLDDGTNVATQWRPGLIAPPVDEPVAPAASLDFHDWEADSAPIADCLRRWAKRRGWTRLAASGELRVPHSTYDGWCAGRRVVHEKMVRRIMTLLDAQ